MDRAEDLNLLNEMNEFLANTGNPAAPADAEIFSEDSISFEDATVLIWDHTEDIYALTKKYGKLSSEYQKSLRILMKAVGHLGSACITKAALNRSGRPTPKLEHLSVERLHQMISCSYRKTDSAMRAYEQDRHEISFDLFDTLDKLYVMLGRLRSTEQRCVEIRACMVDSLTLSDTGYRFSKKKNQDPGKPAMPFRNAPAYEIRREELAGTGPMKAEEKPRIDDPLQPEKPPLPAGNLPPCVGGPEPKQYPKEEIDESDLPWQASEVAKVDTKALTAEIASGKNVSLNANQARALLGDPEFPRLFPQVCDDLWTWLLDLSIRGNSS